ncbi:helix-turn-helix domain-containing protein [Tabrizicola sp. J26]|uniref:helix-turn-helix domain-containing protein n=1 Tax=Alitabrizicola rongguiensis TaxID=2909234 RepID=UPI001F35CD5B|nr:helix-turn-helix domain-containing protein [Tabrizicola rongguiensis]MCF1709453.1 helix-turn-helix domain-containing protein [Tabrizicola rongguiensis]
MAITFKTRPITKYPAQPPAAPAPSQPLPDEFLTIAEAAELSRASESSVRRWERRGVFRKFRSGKKILIAKVDLLNFLRQN